MQQNKSTGTYIPELVSRLLKAKGFLNQDDQLEFLNPSMKDIKSPFVLNGMDQGCVRLSEALKNNEKIGIYCDYDLDGSSAAAILFDGFGQLGFNDIEIYQPRRLAEGYGFHKAGVDYFKEKGVSVIVTVDVGITAHETCLYAKDEGLDVILTDHHLPDATLPEALTVINPNTKECTAGLGHLCGAGVAFYLVYGLAKYLKDSGEEIKQGFSLDSLLDLFVIGTLTDMVPLIKENRVLVKSGLKKFSSTKRPGLLALKARSELMGKQISSSDIGFKLAPKLNSLSRLDTELRPTTILIEEDRETAEKLVAEAFLVNEKRVKSLEEGLKEAIEYFKENTPEGVCFFVSEDIHPGVMGLIATRVVEEYGAPAFIGSILANGQIVGSARLPAKTGLSLKEMMSFCPSLIQFGGHAEAAGFELKFEKAAQFKNELSMYLEDFSTKEANIAFGPKYDCEVYLEELNREFLSWLKHLEPFGVGFEQPIFKVSDLEIASVRKLKDKHYKLLVSDKKGKTFDVLWFSPAKDHEVALMIESQNYVNYKFNFYVNPNVNFFRKTETLQL
ncbi:MAG: single-stranded-DNA-specific exonuclease RecJ, partial [Bdellovibrionales bacterium]